MLLLSACGPQTQPVSEDQKYVHQALTAFEANNYKESLRLSDAAVATNSENVEARRLRGQSLYRLGYYAKAIPDLELVTANQSLARIEDHLALLKCLSLTHQYSRVLSLSQCIVKSGQIKDSQQLQDVFQAMGIAYFAKHDLENAIQALENAKECPPFNLDLWLDYANMLVENGEYGPAYDVYREISTHNFADKKTFETQKQRVAKIFLDRGGKGLREHGYWEPAYIDAGYAFLLQGDGISAYQSSGRAIWLKPKDPEAWRIRGEACYLMKRWKEGIEAFRKAAALDSKNEFYQDMQKVGVENLRRLG